MSDREARPKGYTENKCPATLEAVAERGEDCLLCGCPALAHDSELVSGRINTSGGEEARAALDALKPEKPPWLGGPVKGAKADPQCPDGYPYEAERQVIAAEKALKPQPIQTYTASHTGPLGVSSEAEKDESALAPENVEWNNPGRLRQGVKDALAIERQVRLGRMDEDYELAPAAAYRKLYAEYRRLAEGQQPSTSENPDAEESPKPDPDSARRCAEPAVRAALPVIAEAGYRAGIEDARASALSDASIDRAAKADFELDRRDDRRWEHVSEQSRVVYRRGIRAALLAALTDSEGRHE